MDWKCHKDRINVFLYLGLKEWGVELVTGAVVENVPAENMEGISFRGGDQYLPYYHPSRIRPQALPMGTGKLATALQRGEQ